MHSGIVVFGNVWIHCVTKGIFVIYGTQVSHPGNYGAICNVS